MKSVSKKLSVVLISVFAVVFFSAITLVLAVTGEIDLSGIPVVNSLVSLMSDDSENFVLLNNAVAQNVLPKESYTSITDITVDGNYIYAADKTGMKVHKLDLDGNITATYNAESQVNAVYSSNGTVYALTGGADGKVVLLSSSLTKTSSIAVGHTPSAMIIKGTKAFIANRFDNNLSVINLNTKEVIGTISVNGREPIDITLANDKLYVACHLPEDASNEEVVSANVAVINPDSQTVVQDIELVNGAGSVKGIIASPDGKTVYVSHVIARYTYPTTQLDRGWINTNGFSLIDTTDNSTVAVMLDEVELGAANPWGIDISDDGTVLCVALSGTDEIMLVDTVGLAAKISAVKNGDGVVESVEKTVDYLPFLDGLRTRIKLNGKGARSLCIKDSKAYIGQYFTANIAVVDLSSKKQTDTFMVAEQPENDVVRQGEILFSDANLCYQKWQSCLSCHPDALADGFNWDNMNDGLGNPKSAKSLLYSHRTPPVMITGIRDGAETAVKAGMKFIQFNVLEENKLDCIDKYLLSLQPEQSPYLNSNGTLTESAERGKELFESEGCATCHPAPLYTDMKKHNVGSTDNDGGNWENRDLDTPTLVEVWRTGAWMHDGRYNNIEDAVRYFAPDLTDTQIKDLANFVLSIGDEGEDYGVEQVFVKKGDDVTVSALVEGSSVIGFTLRCQEKDVDSDITVTATLKDSDGNTIKTYSKNISDLAFNTATAIELPSGFEVPSQNTKGVTFTITIKNSSGKNVATPYIISY